MVAKIVVGANFGDEGKGLMTDYFCRQAALTGDKCLVVLHNGGAQRGHTVVTPNKKRHVFHHFGSGAFVGADTYFSEDFILNPLVFRQEWEELKKIGITPNVYVNHECKVTTPFDMILNQIIEESRENARHGSCGMGIHETTIRDVCNYSFEIWENSSDKEKIHYLKEIRNYLNERLRHHGIAEVPDRWKEIVESDVLIRKFVNDFIFMNNRILTVDHKVFRNYGFSVFENAQGLLLDQNNTEYYPHLTPSNTGIKNPIEIISKMDCKSDIEVCYVTRTYLTRHGAGRLDGECDKSEINPDMQDMTNVPNPHQGTLRYAKLDEKSLKSRIFNDFELAKTFSPKISLAITHVNEKVPCLTNDFLNCFDNIYISDGQTRNSIVRCENGRSKK